MNGRPRKVTDDQVKLIREWLPLTELCRPFGITAKMAYRLRSGYKHKKPSP